MHPNPTISDVPSPVVTAVVVTLAAEAFAIPTFLHWASVTTMNSPKSPFYVAAACGAVAAFCALGTLAGVVAARKTLFGIALISLILGALPLPFLLLLAPAVGEILLADIVFVATSAAVLALLSRPESAPTARAMPDEPRSSVRNQHEQGPYDVVIIVFGVVGSITVLIAAGLLALVILA